MYRYKQRGIDDCVRSIDALHAFGVQLPRVWFETRCLAFTDERSVENTAEAEAPHR